MCGNPHTVKWVKRSFVAILLSEVHRHLGSQIYEVLIPVQVLHTLALHTKQYGRNLH